MSNILNNISKKLLIIGRAGMDIYPEPPGVKTEDAENFSAHLGGSAANTCVALNQFGIKTDLVTCISDDSIGKFVKKELEKFQIGIQHCRDPKTVNQFSIEIILVIWNYL